jgi:hypothetical protein
VTDDPRREAEYATRLERKLRMFVGLPVDEHLLAEVKRAVEDELTDIDDAERSNSPEKP